MDSRRAGGVRTLHVVWRRLATALKRDTICTTGSCPPWSRQTALRKRRSLDTIEHYRNVQRPVGWRTSRCKEGLDPVIDAEANFNTTGKYLGTLWPLKPA